MNRDSDYLIHWKYVKKVKANGRWRYYYDDSSDKAKRTAYKNAEREYQTAEMRKIAAESNYRFNSEMMIKDGLNKYEARKLAYHKSKAEHFNREYVEAGKKYVAAKKEYMSTRVGHVAQSVISKGAVAVNNLLSKLLYRR